MFKFIKRRNHRFDSTTSIGSTSKVSKDTNIGNYCYIGERCDITRATIGNYVSIANNVSIGPGEHPIDRISTHSIFYDAPYLELTRGDCTIGSDAWIGVDCIVRRGVSIGIGAVIGANSFVNEDIPDFAIAVGSPAKVIRYRFSPDKQQIILASRWWEKTFEEARKSIAALARDLS
ncbi:CatB-related O-acetyltransferase [Oryzibacter oryziterrae]|uniref:CatB-related O-acetyltransferase n=1 Tax=Oryzibacter oryziterrae TaxID=2766474 RepID=UPI001F2DAB38|nr:CatB-related O-acetyltransferase [Oryzibacter oryziterrae]